MEVGLGVRGMRSKLGDRASRVWGRGGGQKKVSNWWKKEGKGPKPNFRSIEIGEGTCYMSTMTSWLPLHVVLWK